MTDRPSDPFDPSRPVGAVNPYAAPASDIVPPAPALEAPATSRGAQVAGALMLASAPATLISVSSSGGAGFAGSAIVDILLGISLVRGSLKWRGFAIFRVVLGAVIFGGKELLGPNILAGVFSFAYAVPFLLLLLGTPGKARTIVGGVVGGVLLALIYVGLAMQRQ
ncbi:MAG: hypothetical protein JO090_05905 [Rhizobacter sp.]|nr:hypothetical protein [Rhizobacter sp.]